MTRPRPSGRKRLNLRPAAIRPPAPARPDPSDAIARIDTLTRTARASWLGLISYLAFVGVTLMGVEDADFFIPERQTDLPLIGVSIPTLLFFAIAPTLGAALYAYFHLHLLKLWDALRDALPPPVPVPARDRGWLGRLIRDLRSNFPAARGAEPRGPEDAPLGDRIAPWLVTDLALSFRADALTHRPLRWIAFLSTGILSFIAGPVVLFFFWLWSMPAHNALLTVVGCGLPFFVSVITCISSWRQMRHRVLRTPSLTRVEKRRRDGAAWSVFAVIVVAGWFATEGTLDHYARTWFGHDDDRIEASWWSGTPFPGLLVSADLSGVDFVGAGTRVELRDKAKVAFRADWCEAQGIPPQACSPDGRTDTDAGRAFAMAQREAWCAAGLRLAPEPCAARFRDLEATFESDWQTARAALLASLDRRDLSGRDLRGANLSGARLEGATLFEARLQGAILQGARLEGADLTGARLEGSSLFRARLEEARLAAARLDGAYLWETRLDGAELRRANLEGAALTSVDLTRTTLDNAWHQAFGDGSVILPAGYAAGETPLEHWDPDNLAQRTFFARWRAWQFQIGFSPPER